MKGHAYMSLEVWKKADTHEEAKKVCDENEECAGYHLHGHMDSYFLFEHTNEIVDQTEGGEFIKDFVVYKKRMMTCQSPGEEPDEDFDTLPEADEVTDTAPNSEEL